MIIRSYFAGLSRRWAITLSVFFALIFCIDFALRLYVSRPDVTKRIPIPEITAPTDPPSMAVMREKLLRWFPPEIAEGDAAKPKAEPVLKAVFKSTTATYAVLFLVRADGSIEDRVKAKVGDRVDEWVVQSIARPTVVLTRGDDSRTLTLFKSAR